MINFEVLNNALGKVTPSEFTVLYYIANNLSLKNTTRAKIYRDQVADKLNLSTKQVSRLTDGLAEKGFLKKEKINESSVKTVVYCSLLPGKNVDTDVQEQELKVDKNVPLKKNKNSNKKKLNKIKIEDQGSDSDNSFEDYLRKLESEFEREADSSQ